MLVTIMCGIAVAEVFLQRWKEYKLLAHHMPSEFPGELILEPGFLITILSLLDPIVKGSNAAMVCLDSVGDAGHIEDEEY